MANIYANQQPDNWGTPTPNYPQGVPQDEAPGVSGTYWDANIIKDMMGFFQGLLAQAGVTPNNTPDTAVSSQYIDAMKQLAQGTDINTTLVWNGSSWDIETGSYGVSEVDRYNSDGNVGRTWFFLKLSVSYDTSGMFVTPMGDGISVPTRAVIETNAADETVLSLDGIPPQESLVANKSKINIVRFTRGIPPQES